MNGHATQAINKFYMLNVEQPRNRPEIKDIKTEKEQPKMTVFLLRHGESESDKSKANRGLTELGKDQVRESITTIVRDLVQEVSPDFNDWNNKDTVTAALAGIEFHLRDSGTERTKQQVVLERDLLVEAGVPLENIILPKGIYENITPPQGAGPGIAKRLEGVRGMDHQPKYRAQLKSKTFQEYVGANSDIEAWALSDRDEVPTEVESRQEMETRYAHDIAIAERGIRMLNTKDKRTITIANSHASIATLAAASELNVPLDKLMRQIGEVPGAQGLRYDFYGSKDKSHETKPFGKDVEAAMRELKNRR